jgi:hypothetical protein
MIMVKEWREKVMCTSVMVAFLVRGARGFFSFVALAVLLPFAVLLVDDVFFFFFPSSYLRYILCSICVFGTVG